VQKRGIQEAKYRPFESVIEQCKKVHNDFYDYSKIVDYTIQEKEYTFICPTHGEFKQKMSNHMTGRRCKKCAVESIKKKNTLSQEVAYNKCVEAQNGKYTYPDFNYISDRTNIKVKCEKHGIFEQIPLNHFKGVGCPQCVGVDSKAEIEIRDFLKSHIEIIHSDRTIMENRKEVDIFIPSKNIALEYNGLYYHSDKFQEEDYHLRKTEDCLKKNIKLIHIFEDEWKTKQDIVKSRLLNLIGKTDRKIYGRETTVKEIDSKTHKEFLQENHIQGAVGAKTKLGLFYKEELVSVMSFGELRKNLGSKKQKGVYELLRFCNKLNTNIVGGASKLLKHFEVNYDYDKIISYADRRWSNGELYETIGFTKESISKPNYFYTRGSNRENRFLYRKDVLVAQGHDKNKTEKQIMKELGYNRIYDCGSLKYIKTKNQKECRN